MHCCDDGFSMALALALKFTIAPALDRIKFDIVFDIVHCLQCCQKAPLCIFHSVEIFDSTVNNMKCQNAVTQFRFTFERFSVKCVCAVLRRLDDVIALVANVVINFAVVKIPTILLNFLGFWPSSVGIFTVYVPAVHVIRPKMHR